MGSQFELLIVLTTIAVDQITKLAARRQLKNVYLNRGIIFSLYQGNATARIAWTGIQLLPAVLAYFYLPGAKQYAVLASAGVISNLIDFLRLGGVIDWIHLPNLPWRTNLADFAITFGLAISLSIYLR